jgi:acyl-coenzyme A synthetase/AMP-(fatty) acid ligase
MVKKRGYRVELGEIESCLYHFPAMKEIGVVASRNDEGVRITCFFATDNGTRPSAVELKRFCAERLPLYMVPDTFSPMDVLPRTSTGKVDYQQLLINA